MTEAPYPIWKDVPVMYPKDAPLEMRMRHRIRRAVEKYQDRTGYGQYEVALMVWERLRPTLEEEGLI